MPNIDEENDLNVASCSLHEFTLALRTQLELVTELKSATDAEGNKLDLAKIRRPNLVIGAPGIGKTCSIMSVIEELNAQLPKERKLKFKKLMLGRYAVGQLTGVPVVVDGKVEREVVPDLPRLETDGEYGVLLLDELTTVDDQQVQPALGLTDDSRCVGATYKLPEHWVVVAAGNGPECANFLQLQDMTLNRFAVYNIKYDYVEDWRRWAQANNIDNRIIAFLNFKPEFAVKVESDALEDGNVGKQFPSPRSWERLSDELAMRSATGRPVTQGELTNFAARIIGRKAAVEFHAFSLYSADVKENPDDIIEGKITSAIPANGEFTTQAYLIMLQQLVRRLKKIFTETKTSDNPPSYPLETYQKLGNVIRWVISADEVSLSATAAAIASLTGDIDDLVFIFQEEFDILTRDDICPEFNTYIMEHADAINSFAGDFQQL